MENLRWKDSSGGKTDLHLVGMQSWLPHGLLAQRLTLQWQRPLRSKALLSWPRLGLRDAYKAPQYSGMMMGAD
eukprot:1138961-Pelagomonas_calceolata.AAC.13